MDRFQRWKYLHHWNRVNYSQIGGLNNSNSLVGANSSPFTLRHFLAKSQKRWICFRQCLGCLRSIFNTECLYTISAELITVQLAVLLTLIALYGSQFITVYATPFSGKIEKRLDLFQTIVWVFEVRFQRWKSLYHRSLLQSNWCFEYSNSLMEDNLLPFTLHYFLVK